MDRRQLLGACAALPLAFKGVRSFAQGSPKAQFKQGVCDSVFGDMPFEDRCKLAAACGAKGYDFIPDPALFPIVKRHGLQLTIIGAALEGKHVLRPPNAPAGWNSTGIKEAQGAYLEGVKQAIDVAAANGCPNVLLQSGSRNQVSSIEGADNTVEFVNKVKGLAEAKGITLCLELTNSYGIQSTPNSLFDRADWGWSVAKRVNSRSFRILFDIWHDALMEGNVSQKIRENIQWIGHMHTGSIGADLPPGRYELWRNNELDYRHIAQVIAKTGFQGFVSHEWRPSPGSDVTEDLRKTIELMTV